MYFALVKNVIALLFLCTAVILIELSINKKYSHLVLGIIFGFITVFVMYEKIIVVDGRYLDFHYITMTMAGFIGGPVTALIAAIISSIFRYNRGGIGMISGISTIITFGGFGCILKKFGRKHQRSDSYLYWFGIGILMTLLFYLVIILVPPWTNGPIQALEIIIIPFSIITPFAVAILFNMFFWIQKHMGELSIFKMIINRSHLNLMIFNSNGTILESKNMENNLDFKGLLKEPFLLLNADKTSWFCASKQEQREIILDNGKQILLDLSSFKMPTGEYACVVILNDITERKKDEELLRLAEERFSKAFYASPDLKSIVRDSDMTYIDVNHQFLDTIKLKRQDVIGKTANVIGISEEMRNKVWEVIHEFGEIHNMEIHVKTKSLLTSGVPISLNGEKCHLFSYNDITEMNNMQAELSRLGRLELVGQMAAGIGHEIRNPMTTVRGYLQLLGAKSEYTAQKSTFDLMISELDRANSIITDFLSLARTRPSEPKNVNLNEILKKLYPLLECDAFNQNKQICFIPMQLPNLELDEKEIAQLILNLTRNGLEAMEEQGAISIFTYVEGDEAVLKVEDEGCGIPPENLEKLGTPFFTTKANGTGLGLATSYKIADSHNAKIEVGSSRDGTTFYVRFPITQVQLNEMIV